MTHLATTAQPATAPQPHVRRDRSRRRTVIAVTAAYLAAAAFRIALSATRVGPLVVGDEIGYLAHARWLAGGPGILMQGTYYYSGSSLFMAPAFWITDNAVTAYQVVLVIQALISAAVLPLLYAFCREIGASSARSLGAAIVGSTIVDAVFWSSYALSESLLAALTVAWVWLTARVIRHGRSRAGLVSAGTLGLVYGLLAAAHSRGLILVGIGALVGVSFIRWAGWRNVLLCTGVGAVSVAGALWLNVATMHANYPTHAVKVLIPNGGGAGIEGVTLADQLVTALGQVWYAAAATGLLALYGIFHAWRAGLSAPPGEKAPRLTAAILLTAGCGAIVFGVAVLRSDAVIPSLDYLVYGRYVACCLPLAATIGMLGLLGRADRTAWVLRGATVASTVAVCALVRVQTAGIDPTTAAARPFPIPAVYALAGVVAGDSTLLHELRVTAAAVVFFATICALGPIRHTAARVALVAVPTVAFAALSAIAVSTITLAQDERTYPDGGTAVEAVDDARTIAWDTSIGGSPTSEVVTRMRFAYFADEAELIPFDSRTEDPPDGVDAVAATATWDGTEHGFEMVTPMPPVDVVLWEPVP